MKRMVIVLAAIAALGFASSANAADMPAKAPAYKAPAQVPINWTGFYVGGHLGAAWSHLTMTDVGNAGGVAFASAGTAGQQFTNSNTGIFGGGQIGYNYQVNQWVLGLEADIGGMGLHGSTLDPGTTSNTTVGIKSGLYGDITGRVGMAFGPTLAYAKGGWAVYDGKQSFSTTSAAFISNTNVNTFSGWTLGGGLEYMFTPNWSAKVEYMHFDFGTQSFNVTATGGVFPFQEKLTADTVKVGINYLFR